MCYVLQASCILQGKQLLEALEGANRILWCGNGTCSRHNEFAAGEIPLYTMDMFGTLLGDGESPAEWWFSGRRHGHLQFV